VVYGSYQIPITRQWLVNIVGLNAIFRMLLRFPKNIQSARLNNAKLVAKLTLSFSLPYSAKSVQKEAVAVVLVVFLVVFLAAPTTHTARAEGARREHLLIHDG